MAYATPITRAQAENDAAAFGRKRGELIGPSTQGGVWYADGEGGVIHTPEESPQSVEIMRHEGHPPQVVLTLPAEQYASFADAMTTLDAEGIPAAAVQIYAEGNDHECYSLIATHGHWRSFEEFAKTLVWEN